MIISIITACYNAASTLAETIDSVQSQTYEDWEHCIVDGKSTDDTAEICSAASDRRRHVISETDSGVYDAMCKGIASASGDVIGFLNADDFYETPEVLDKVAATFAETDADLVYGNLRYVDFDHTDRVIRDWRSEPFREGMFNRGWMPPHPTVYARREVFRKVGAFDNDFDICADWEWLYRAFELHQVKTRHIDEYLVRMRLGGVSNRSIGNVLRSNRQAARAFRKHGRRVPPGFFPGKLVHRFKQFL